jgi:hypothetical protein
VVGDAKFKAQLAINNITSGSSKMMSTAMASSKFQSSSVVRAVSLKSMTRPIQLDYCWILEVLRT